MLASSGEVAPTVARPFNLPLQRPRHQLQLPVPTPLILLYHRQGDWMDAMRRRLLRILMDRMYDEGGMATSDVGFVG